MSGSKDLKPQVQSGEPTEGADTPADTPHQNVIQSKILALGARVGLEPRGTYIALGLGIFFLFVLVLAVIGSQVKSQDEKPCYSDPCLNGGNCTQGNNMYTCACTVSHEGLNCQNKNLCYSDPCLNGGNCMQQNNMYTCACTALHEGLNCQNKKPCYSDPCLNGGNCMQQNNMYTCACTALHGGLNCQNKNLCYSDPCLNGGNCMQQNNMYTCACTALHEGLNCQNKKAMPCASDPCLNGGTCIYQVATTTNYTHTCACTLIYSGQNCEESSLKTGCKAEPQIPKKQCMYAGVTKVNCELGDCCYNATSTPACFHYKQTDGTQVKHFTRYIGDCNARLIKRVPLNLRECAKQCIANHQCQIMVVCTACSVCYLKKYRCNPPSIIRFGSRPHVITFELTDLYPREYVCRPGLCGKWHYAVSMRETRECYDQCKKDRRCKGITLKGVMATSCSLTSTACYMESELNTTTARTHFCYHKSRKP